MEGSVKAVSALCWWADMVRVSAVAGGALHAINRELQHLSACQPSGGRGDVQGCAQPGVQL